MFYSFYQIDPAHVLLELYLFHSILVHKYVYVCVCVCVCVCVYLYLYTHMYLFTYCKELAYVIMEADQSPKSLAGKLEI